MGERATLPERSAALYAGRLVPDLVQEIRHLERENEAVRAEYRRLRDQIWRIQPK